MYSRPNTCTLPGCRRPNQQAAGNGHSRRYCKRHVEINRRHGSYWHRSLTATELKPFREAARSWLRRNVEDMRVKMALQSISARMEAAGHAENAYSLRRRSADEKARVALARLRNADISPNTILERIIAVTACCEAKGIDDRQREYRQVQLAKSIHRLASGTHKTPSGYPLPSKYPRSEGRILRKLGLELDDIAAFTLDGREID